MRQIFLVSLLLIYLAIAACFFTNWFEFFKRDASKLSAKEKQLSVMTLAIASLLWPIAVPIAYLEKLSKAKQTITHRVGAAQGRSLISPQIEAL